MGGCCRRDDERIHPGGEDGVEVGGRAGCRVRRGDGLDGRSERIRDDELVDLVETREGSCVKGADPAEADDADSHSHQSSPPMTI